MDDIHVGGKSPRELVDNLKILLDRLFKNNLKIRLSKTLFFPPKVCLLGVIFSAVGKQVDPSKVSTIRNFGPIDTLKKCQAFLGMLAFINSFIPHFSTVCAPLYNWLKDQKNKKFTLTKEAITAYEAIKEYVANTALLYHPNFEEPLYLATDASNVGVGGFLYQVKRYRKNEEGKKQMLQDLGFEIESTGMEPYMLPGVCPGKNTPVVTDFLDDTDKLKKFDLLDTLNTEKTMTEKVKEINEKYVLHVRPIAFFSKTFSSSQVQSYCTMEKEFMSMVLAIQNFRDYLSAVPVTYVLTDSQPVCWALRHKDQQLKLSRWLLKIFELRVSIIVTHVSGCKNGVADFLSRQYYVPVKKAKNKSFDELQGKSAQHIKSPFSPCEVLTKEMILERFDSNCVTPCKNSDFCHLNVNNYLFKNLGPFKYEYTCLDNPAEVRKILTDSSFTFTPASLAKFLTLENIQLEQNKDEKMLKIIESIHKGENPIGYVLKNNVLCKTFENKIPVIFLPQTLVPYAIASVHFETHVGVPKLLYLIKLKYFWKNMLQDVKSFTQGCVLCQIFKPSLTGPTEIGTPRLVLEPGACWQIDIVSGLPSVNGSKSFLTMIDMFTGFVVAVPLKNETTLEIAKIVENNLIKIFGTPKEISSDNAANLAGPPMKKLCAFYNISYRTTIPYSPTSHSLVEIANRYLVQLARIFADQFATAWVNVLTLSCLMYNSVPRPQLSNFSPYFLMFNREPFAENEFTKQKLKNLDIPDFVARSLNDRIFAKLLRERLLKIREKRNLDMNYSYKSYPKGTLILIKDMQPKVHRKVKPIFHKIPQKVVNEYRCTVFATDLLGRIRKHSKNNVRKCNDRTENLFANLPDDVKLVLGDVMTSEKFDELKSEGKIPKYLLDIEIDFEIGPVTRGAIPKDTHLVEESPAVHDVSPINESFATAPVDTGEEEEEDAAIDDLLSDKTLRQLGALHDEQKLNDTSITLKDINNLFEKEKLQLLPPYRSNSENIKEIIEELLVPDTIELSTVTENVTLIENVPNIDNNIIIPTDPAGINIENILPEGTRRRRAVRFNLP
jgi:hypothetical protein